MHSPLPPQVPSTKALLLQVFAPFALGYFLSAVFRTVNAVIAGDLQRDLGIGAAELGLLTSVLFLAFACFQLPIGLLLDRYGPRRVEAMLLLLAAAGSLIFAFGQNLAALTIGRALIGLGVSACLMASFKAFAIWFDRHQLTLANGYLMAFGGLGAMAASVPVEVLVSAYSWRTVFVLLAVASVAASAVLWIAVPERSQKAAAEPLARQVQGMLAIFASRPFRAVAPAAFSSHALGLAVMGLWTGPWLRDVGGFDRGEVAHHLLYLGLAYTLGLAGWATLASRLDRLGVPPMRMAAVGMGLFWIANVLVALQPSGHYLGLWIFYGFVAASSSLFYAGLARDFPSSLTGRVNASLNLLVFVGAFFLQWALGAVVELWATPTGPDPRGYAVAFAGTALLQGLALIWLCLQFRAKALTSR